MPGEEWLSVAAVMTLLSLFSELRGTSLGAACLRSMAVPRGGKTPRGIAMRQEPAVYAPVRQLHGMSGSKIQAFYSSGSEGRLLPLLRAMDPSHARLGRVCRSNVVRSTPIRPKVGAQ